MGINIKLANRLLKSIGEIDPPGCCSDDLEHPSPSLRKKRLVEIGFVIEHRFAFYYWLRCKQKMMVEERSRSRSADKNFRPPDLITWDWHDDVGGECDFDKKELADLNQANEEEVALFCWAGLQQINDGHIAPALWLNALGNVYVLQKQKDCEDCQRESGPFEDRYGQVHNVWYFRSPKNLAKHFAKSNSKSGVIWDVDLDFFTKGEEVPDQCYTPPVSARTIRTLLNPQKLWMQQILGGLRAVTIALEPVYTGGLTQSLVLYKTWEECLFDAPVFSENCRWREDLLLNRPTIR